MNTEAIASFATESTTGGQDIPLHVLATPTAHHTDSVDSSDDMANITIGDIGSDLQSNTEIGSIESQDVPTVPLNEETGAIEPYELFPEPVSRTLLPSSGAVDPRTTKELVRLQIVYEVLESWAKQFYGVENIPETMTPLVTLRNNLPPLVNGQSWQDFCGQNSGTPEFSPIWKYVAARTFLATRSFERMLLPESVQQSIEEFEKFRSKIVDPGISPEIITLKVRFNWMLQQWQRFFARLFSFGEHYKQIKRKQISDVISNIGEKFLLEYLAALKTQVLAIQMLKREDPNSLVLEDKLSLQLLIEESARQLAHRKNLFAHYIHQHGSFFKTDIRSTFDTFEKVLSFRTDRVLLRQFYKDDPDINVPISENLNTVETLIAHTDVDSGYADWEIQYHTRLCNSWLDKAIDYNGFSEIEKGYKLLDTILAMSANTLMEQQRSNVAAGWKTVHEQTDEYREKFENLFLVAQKLDKKLKVLSHPDKHGDCRDPRLQECQRYVKTTNIAFALLQYSSENIKIVGCGILVKHPHTLTLEENQEHVAQEKKSKLEAERRINLSLLRIKIPTEKREAENEARFQVGESKLQAIRAKIQVEKATGEAETARRKAEMQAIRAEIQAAKALAEVRTDMIEIEKPNAHALVRSMPTAISTSSSPTPSEVGLFAHPTSKSSLTRENSALEEITLHYSSTL